MAKLSSTAWIAHDLGLATAIGGTLFGRQAFQPSLREVEDEQERAAVSDVAWRRFSWVNLAAHTVMAVTWFTGRSMLSGREVSGTSRALTRVKDGLVIGSLVTGIASVLLGRRLGSRAREMEGGVTEAPNRRLRRAVGMLGMTNLALNAGIGAVTTALAMEASKSMKFSVRSRRLP
jgi:uncharacterized membrane protein